MKKNTVFSMSNKLNNMLLDQATFDQIMSTATNARKNSVGAIISGVIGNQANLVQQFCDIPGSIIVYALVERSTGKTYVGETAHPLMRWNKEFYLHGRIGVALKNYSNLLAGFGIVILSVESNKRASQTKEAYYIEAFESCNTSCGYNVNSRGPVLSEFKRENKIMLTNVSKKPNTYKFVADLHVGIATHRVMFSSMKQCVTVTGLPISTVKRAVHRANKTLNWIDAKEVRDVINNANGGSNNN